MRIGMGPKLGRAALQSRCCASSTAGPSQGKPRRPRPVQLPPPPTQPLASEGRRSNTHAQLGRFPGVPFYLDEGGEGGVALWRAPWGVEVASWRTQCTALLRDSWGLPTAAAVLEQLPTQVLLGLRYADLRGDTYRSFEHELQGHAAWHAALAGAAATAPAWPPTDCGTSREVPRTGPPAYGERSCVYVLPNRTATHFKVGISSDPGTRLRELWRCYGHESKFEMVYCIDLARKVEQLTHLHLAAAPWSRRAPVACAACGVQHSEWFRGRARWQRLRAADVHRALLFNLLKAHEAWHAQGGGAQPAPLPQLIQLQGMYNKGCRARV